MWLSVFAVSSGAVIGANLRWALALLCNRWFADIPPGTLIANLTGAWLIGIAISFFSHSSLSPEWRLFVITGLLGALTTFSTFSLEMVAAIQAGKWLMAALGVISHVAGSLLLTILGIASYEWLRG
jgi:CrcB protein